MTRRRAKCGKDEFSALSAYKNPTMVPVAPLTKPSSVQEFIRNITLALRHNRRCTSSDIACESILCFRISKVSFASMSVALFKCKFDTDLNCSVSPASMSIFSSSSVSMDFAFFFEYDSVFGLVCTAQQSTTS